MRFAESQSFEKKKKSNMHVYSNWETSTKEALVNFPKIARAIGVSYFKYRKRCLCALWSLGAGAAAGCCCPCPRALLERCVWPCALAVRCVWTLRGAAPGCFCEMSVAVCALQSRCWCRCSYRCYGAANWPTSIFCYLGSTLA